jgi:hypothetical protein
VTDEDRVELGLRAEALLQTNTFKFLIDHLGEQYANAILTSAPAQADVREENYHLHHALQAIVEQLGIYVAAAHKLIQDGQSDEGQQEDEE